MDHSLPKNQQFRGVCEINEDGYGGFTMDSVFYHADVNEEYVTSIFKKINHEAKIDHEVPRKPDDWNPKGFNYKAAVGGSFKKKVSKEKKDSIERTHYAAKHTTKVTQIKEGSSARRSLINAFSDAQSDVLKDVSNKFADISIQQKGEVHKDSFTDIVMDSAEEKVDKVSCEKEEGLDDLVSDLKKEHGRDCVCEDYIKDVARFYESLGAQPFNFSKLVSEAKGKEVDDQSTDEEERMEESESEEEDDGTSF